MIRNWMICFLALAVCSITAAQTTAPALPPTVLPNRPDAAGPGGAEDLLGETFESAAAGISFRRRRVGSRSAITTATRSSSTSMRRATACSRSTGSTSTRRWR